MSAPNQNSSETPFADSHFVDLVKERDSLQSQLSQRNVQLKSTLEKLADVQAINRLQADRIKELEDQLVGKP